MTGEQGDTNYKRKEGKRGKKRKRESKRKRSEEGRREKSKEKKRKKKMYHEMEMVINTLGKNKVRKENNKGQGSWGKICNVMSPSNFLPNCTLQKCSL